MAPTSPPPVLTTYDPIAALPAGYMTETFTTFKRLARAAQSVCSKLDTDPDHANQYIVVYYLSDYAKDQIRNESDILGVSFRFEFDGNMGIIKVMPGHSHESPNGRLQLVIHEKLIGMGIPGTDCEWIYSSEHPKTVSTKSKQPDQGLKPPSRFPDTQPQTWPTLVMETGDTEAFSKLRADALWWFNNSRGDVRIVIAMKVRRTTKKVELEKWQLAPPNSPPLTRALTDFWRAQAPPVMPPLVQQPASTQQAYCLQEIEFTANTATGSLTLPFLAVYDRPPGPGESDIVITPADFCRIARFVGV